MTISERSWQRARRVAAVSRANKLEYVNRLETLVHALVRGDLDILQESGHRRTGEIEGVGSGGTPEWRAAGWVPAVGGKAGEVVGSAGNDNDCEKGRRARFGDAERTL